jgi:hypothetical protein
MLTGKPLFQGDSPIDMLFKIFDLFGVPTEQEWPGVTKFIKKSMFPDWKKNNFFSRYKNLPKDALDLLSVFF